jgi:ribonuclease R
MSKLIVNNLGCGFINQDDKTIFIPRKKLNGAMNGDIVEYQIIDEATNVACVSNILEMVPDYGFVSHTYQDSYVVKTDRKQYYFKIDKHELNINDFVKVHNDLIIVNYGDKNSFLNKIKYIKDKYNINTTEFPVQISDFDVEEKEEDPDRVDLTELYTFTIDPTSSKDFDDAISIEFKENVYTLGIHIADVTHYLKKDSELDKHAQLKMNTVYLNGDTTHMLPTLLSNNLCSLVPNQDRNAVTVMTKFDIKGNLLEYQIFRSKINSKKRYTYDEVRQQIKGNVEMDVHIKNLNSFIVTKYPHVLEYYSLPIIDIKLDESKSPINVELEEYDMSHIMIEKCMILANEIVAEDLYSKGYNFPYRCHPSPSPDQEEKYLNLKTLSHNPMYQEIIKIKSFKNAFYSYNNISHYGLSSSKYCHFTSPIRRYIDIVVHRILLDEATYTDQELDEICSKSNELEGNAFKAEMELLEMQKQYLITNSDRETEPVIVMDVTKFGISVELTNYLTERRIHISNLDSDILKYDEENKTLYNSNITYKIGDIIDLKIN